MRGKVERRENEEQKHPEVPEISGVNGCNRARQHMLRRREAQLSFSVIANFCCLSSPIRTLPSALELPQVLLLSIQKRLAGFTADQELESSAFLTLPRRQNAIQKNLLSVI